jgi:Uma2 family endonuclease
MAGPSATTIKRWTYADYCGLDDGKRYEVIGGDLVMAPGPGSDHQGISRDIEFLLLRFVKDRSLGQVYYAPLDVIFGDNDVFQPDVLFVSTKNLDRVKQAGVFGAPDLVIEVLSPSTAENDRYHKREVYERAGVMEYWLVDPENRTIEVLANGPKGFELHSFATPDGTARSRVLQGFAVAVKEVIPAKRAEKP